MLIFDLLHAVQYFPRCLAEEDLIIVHLATLGTDPRQSIACCVHRGRATNSVRRIGSFHICVTPPVVGPSHCMTSHLELRRAMEALPGKDSYRLSARNPDVRYFDRVQDTRFERRQRYPIGRMTCNSANALGIVFVRSRSARLYISPGCSVIQQQSKQDIGPWGWSAIANERLPATMLT